MLMQTHSRVGKILYWMIMENADVRLHLKSFKYGCIKPDFAPSLSNTPHYKNKSCRTIYKMIDSLNNFHPKNKQQVKNFSRRLGVIIHYLGDYFCLAHNSTKYDNMNHFIYETRLYMKFSNIDIHSTGTRLWDEMKEIENIQDVSEYIERRHVEYLRIMQSNAYTKDKLSSDTKFILEVSAAVFLFIMKKQM